MTSLAKPREIRPETEMIDQNWPLTNMANMAIMGLKCLKCLKCLKMCQKLRDRTLRMDRDLSQKLTNLSNVSNVLKCLKCHKMSLRHGQESAIEASIEANNGQYWPILANTQPHRCNLETVGVGLSLLTQKVNNFLIILVHQILQNFET